MFVLLLINDIMSKINGYWISNYVDKLNKGCSSLDENRACWSIDDLQPNNIRRYCKKYDSGKTGLCWSCSDYLNKYLEDLAKYELSVNATNDILVKVIEMQKILDTKLDTVISLISNK